MVNRFTLFSTLLLALNFSTFAEKTCPLELRLNVRKSFAKKMNKADVIFINKGKKPVTVLTKGLAVITKFDKISEEEEIIIKASLSELTFEGHQLRTSKYAKLPIDLQPDEATHFQIEDKIFGNPFYKINPEAKSIKVTYQVNEDYGKRFNVWAGSVSSKVFKVINKEIQKNSINLCPSVKSVD